MKRKNNKKATRALTSVINKEICLKSKRSQEEIVGFALIIVIVAVVLLVFLGISLRAPQKETVENYEVNSFIQAFLQYNTNCRDQSDLEFLSVQKLIFNCYDDENCLDERDTCKVLNSTLKDMVEESWKVEGDRPVKGYELQIIVNEEEMLLLKEGNVTGSYKGAMQDFFKSGKGCEIYFKAYY